ncbi:MAG: hypothetical protein RIC38_06110 [Chromatocurvus sp.]
MGLYWLKQYKPLVLQHRVQVTNNASRGLGFAGEAFYRLGQLSPYDLHAGGSWIGGKWLLRQQNGGSASDSRR